MKRVIKLTESDLARIVKRVIKEQSLSDLGRLPDKTTTPKPSGVETTTKISGNGQSLLDNSSETYNSSIGVKTLPACFNKTLYPGSTNFDQIGVSSSEVTDIVNLMDWPMDSSDAQQVLQWAQGNGMTASLGGNYNEFGSIKDRVVQINGKWYPAIEQLRVEYNKDEYFETLGSITKKDLLKNVRNNFVEAYNYWVRCVNGGK